MADTLILPITDRIPQPDFEVRSSEGGTPGRYHVLAGVVSRRPLVPGWPLQRVYPLQVLS